MSSERKCSASADTWKVCPHGTSAQDQPMCCRSRPLHALPGGAQRSGRPYSSSAVTSVLSSWKILHLPEARSRQAVTLPGPRQCTVASGMLASGMVASGTAASARQPAGEAGRREPALAIPPRHARLEWRRGSLFKLRHCLYLTSSMYR